MRYLPLSAAYVVDHDLLMMHKRVSMPFVRRTWKSDWSIRDSELRHGMPLFPNSEFFFGGGVGERFERARKSRIGFSRVPNRIEKGTCRFSDPYGGFQTLARILVVLALSRNYTITWVLAPVTDN